MARTSRRRLVAWFRDPDRNIPSWTREAVETAYSDAGIIVKRVQDRNQTFTTVVIVRRFRGQWVIYGQFAGSGAWERWLLPPGVTPQRILGDLRKPRPTIRAQMSR